MISLLNYPLLAWSRRRSKKLPLDAKDFLIFLGQILALSLLALLEYILMANKFDYWNYIIPANFILFCGILVYMGF